MRYVEPLSDARTKLGAFVNILLGLTPKAEYVAGQVLKLLIRERKFGHNRARRYGLRVAKVLQVPLAVGPSVTHI